MRLQRCLTLPDLQNGEQARFLLSCESRLMSASFFKRRRLLHLPKPRANRGNIPLSHRKLDPFSDHISLYNASRQSPPGRN